MQAVLEHLQTNWMAYSVLLVCALPLLYISRKYSVPAIMYTAEILIYCTLLHGVIHLILILAVWFKQSSSFKNAFEKAVVEETTWTTPLFEPWARELYDPSWVFYLEIVAFVIIFAAVIKYRPMKIHKGRRRRIDDKGKKIGQSARGLSANRSHAHGSAKR